MQCIFGKLIIKAAWRTCRFDSCVGSVYRNNPVPLAVERDNTEQNCSEFHIAIDEAVNIQLKLGLFSWVSLFYLIFELYLDATFRPICNYT